MDSSAVEKIIREIEQFTPQSEVEHVGKVTAVGDGVVAIDGLSKAVMSEIIIFEETKGKKLEHAMEDQQDLYGLILNLEEDGVRAAVLGDTARVMLAEDGNVRLVMRGGRVYDAKALLERAYSWLNGVLEHRAWAAGPEFSLADCAAAPALFYADWVHPMPAEKARLRDYRRRLLARASFARAVDEARPYRQFFPPGAPDRD